MNGPARFRYAVIFLIVVAYVLTGLAFAYGDAQRAQARQLECAVAVAQIAAVRAVLTEPQQPPGLQAARRHVLASWRHLSRSYGCAP